jgi:hypothetical protein
VARVGRLSRGSLCRKGKENEGRGVGRVGQGREEQEGIGRSRNG